ncbi:MAG: hypothetical protein ABIL68_11920 [bacterium]
MMILTLANFQILCMGGCHARHACHARGRRAAGRKFFIGHPGWGLKHL